LTKSSIWGVGGGYDVSRRNSIINLATQRKSLQAKGQILFDCQYYDQRSFEMAMHEITFENLQAKVLEVFEASSITILFGNKYIESQKDIDEMMDETVFRYELALYDALTDDQSDYS